MKITIVKLLVIVFMLGTSSPLLAGTLSDEQVTAVHAGMVKALRDPDSARFGTMGAIPDKDDQRMWTVCLWVNARNAYGGYTGERPYMGVLLHLKAGGYSFVPLPPSRHMSPLAEAEITLSMCRKHGVVF